MSEIVVDISFRCNSPSCGGTGKELVAHTVNANNVVYIDPCDCVVESLCRKCGYNYSEKFPPEACPVQACIIHRRMKELVK